MAKTANKTAEDILRDELETLRGQLAELQEQVTSMRSPRPKITPRFPLWALIRDYLLDLDKPVSIVKLTDELSKAGHRLGRYPLRNIKIALTSPGVAPMFKIVRAADPNDIEMVSLVERAVQFKVSSLRYPPKKGAKK